MPATNRLKTLPICQPGCSGHLQCHLPRGWPEHSGHNVGKGFSLFLAGIEEPSPTIHATASWEAPTSQVYMYITSMQPFSPAMTFLTWHSNNDRNETVSVCLSVGLYALVPFMEFHWHCFVTGAWLVLSHLPPYADPNFYYHIRHTYWHLFFFSLLHGVLNPSVQLDMVHYNNNNNRGGGKELRTRGKF